MRLPCIALVLLVLVNLGDQRLNGKTLGDEKENRQIGGELAQNFNLEFDFEVHFVPDTPTSSVAPPRAPEAPPPHPTPDGERSPARSGPRYQTSC